MQMFVFTQHYLLSTIYSARALEGLGFPSLSHGGSQSAQKCVETRGLRAEMPAEDAEQDRVALRFPTHHWLSSHFSAVSLHVRREIRKSLIRLAGWYLNVGF